MNPGGFSLTFEIGGVQVWPHFDKRDIWIGAYWNVEDSGDPNDAIKEYSVYICLIPCFPIRLLWFR